MRSVAKRFLIVCALVLCASTTVVAQETPEQVVAEMMDKIKEAGTPAPFIDYVNWTSAYDEAPEAMKQQMKVSSGEEMKATFQKMFTDTKGFFEEQFKERLSQIPEEQRGMYEQNLGKMTEMIEAQQAQMKEQIQNTDYSIGETKVDGDEATVKLTQSFEGQTREREIQLTKASGEWLLDSASIFAGDPAAAGQAAGPTPQVAPQEGAMQRRKQQAQ